MIDRLIGCVDGVIDGELRGFDNVMTRVLAGVGRDLVLLGRVGDDEVELAIANVRRHFCLVGSYAQVDADTRAIQQHVMWPTATG